MPRRVLQAGAARTKAERRRKDAILLILINVDLLQHIVYSKLLDTNCDIDRLTSDTVPDSVHQLRPGDIQLIGALGDSLTVGSKV